MSAFVRYAVYFLPRGALAEFGSSWLGWDAALGRAVPQFPVDGLPDATRNPGRYGFHATLKPPFALASGQEPDALEQAVRALAARLAPARAEGLEPARLGRFLALVPKGDASQLSQVAAACVRDLDGFRAPPSSADLERRRKPGMSARNQALLARWGYPHVMEAFRFHMTLSARLPLERLSQIEEALNLYLPNLPSPFILDEIALLGEGEDGMFRLIRRFALTGVS